MFATRRPSCQWITRRFSCSHTIYLNRMMPDTLDWHMCGQEPLSHKNRPNAKRKASPQSSAPIQVEVHSKNTHLKQKKQPTSTRIHAAAWTNKHIRKTNRAIIQMTSPQSSHHKHSNHRTTSTNNSLNVFQVTWQCARNTDRCQPGWGE